MKMQLLKNEFTVCKVEDAGQIDWGQPFTFFAHTDDELSLVCPSQYVPGNTTEAEAGWRAFRICGTLNFSLVGILAKITGILAAADIGLFAISTYNTDYILVKCGQVARATELLTENGYEML